MAQAEPVTPSYGEPASELAALDALLADRQGGWWDAFYADRAKPVPFFGASPDECLSKWVNDGLVPRGAALDLGCGNGRNAIFLAKSGFAVEGVDYSQAAIEWAGQRAEEGGAPIRLTQASVFELDVEPQAYDLIYDSGCFHHMPPHRREGYVRRVCAWLRPGGWFGMVCFRPEGGSGLSDSEVYERKTLGGGLGYTQERLREIWSGPLRIHELLQMKQQPAGSGLFGEPFLWVLLAQKT
nr:class I SAM-dependent methyltransferase [uncultured Roseateles sp.]